MSDEGRKAPNIRLEPLTLDEAEQIRRWRNKDLAPWRTPFMLSAEQQNEWFRNIQDRRANCRYFAVIDSDLNPEPGFPFVGVVGLTDIEWENGIAQVALQIDPQRARKGYGRAALTAILHVAFNSMRLTTVYGECYDCNPAIDFWRHMVEQLSGYWTTLPNRKYYDGAHYDSLYFSFDSWVQSYV